MEKKPEQMIKYCLHDVRQTLKMFQKKNVYLKKECCICGKEFSEFPNNVNPIKDGYCCDECNSRFVYHARLLASKCREPLNFEVVKNG